MLHKRLICRILCGDRLHLLAACAHLLVGLPVHFIIDSILQSVSLPVTQENSPLVDWHESNVKNACGYLLPAASTY